jgi:TPR repeat protein
MRRIAATLAVVVALLFSAGSAWADFDDGFAAYNRGDYATALEEWRPLAEQGDAFAQYNLGLLYYEGEGVSRCGSWEGTLVDRWNVFHHGC